jgi:hypothetical protein
LRHSAATILNKIVNNQAPPEVKLIDLLMLVTKNDVDSYGENSKNVLKKNRGLFTGATNLARALNFCAACAKKSKLSRNLDCTRDRRRSLSGM